MAKWKKQKKIVGRENCTQKHISKPLFNMIVSVQRELQDKENRKKMKPKKITFVYASLELSRRINK
jgi:hypothetical protein